MSNQLTERQIEVLQHICSGWTDKEIATELYLTVGTVKNHVRHCLSKANVPSRHHLALWALRTKLVDIETAYQGIKQRA